MEQESVAGGFSQFGDLSPFYDELMSGVPYAAWVDYVRLLWEVHDCSPRRVLDAACGTGNVSFELARHGYDVVGVDLSASMVAWAQAKLSEEPWLAHSTQDAGGGGGSVSFYAGDLRSFELGARFEAATCLYDSLNYILEPEDLGRAFAQVGAHVEPGGVWVFDMNAPWAFEANLFTQSNRDPRRALHYSWQADFDALSHICTVQMTFEKSDPRSQQGAQTFRETHRERAYEMNQVIGLLSSSGWKLERAYDAYTLNPPHKKSERWYFAARKI